MAAKCRTIAKIVAQSIYNSGVTIYGIGTIPVPPHPGTDQNFFHLMHFGGYFAEV